MKRIFVIFYILVLASFISSCRKAETETSIAISIENAGKALERANAAVTRASKAKEFLAQMAAEKNQTPAGADGKSRAEAAELAGKAQEAAAAFETARDEADKAASALTIAKKSSKPAGAKEAEKQALAAAKAAEEAADRAEVIAEEAAREAEEARKKAEEAARAAKEAEEARKKAEAAARAAREAEEARKKAEAAARAAREAEEKRMRLQAGFIGTDNKRIAGENIIELFEGQPYRISLYIPKDTGAGAVSAELISGEGRRNSFRNFGINKDNYAVSDFMPESAFVAGEYEIRYVINGDEKYKKVNIKDPDTTAPQLVGIPSRAEYKVGRTIDLVFRASDPSGIDAENTRITEAKLNNIVLDIPRAVPKISRVSDPYTYEIAFSIPFPDTKGLDANTQGDMSVQVRLVDGKHKSGGNYQVVQTFRLPVLAGKNQEFSLSETVNGRNIPLAYSRVFYEIRPDVKLDGRVQASQLRTLFSGNIKYIDTDRNGKIVLPNITPGDVVSFVIYEPDRSGYVKQTAVQSVSPEPLTVKYDGLPDEAVIRFNVAKYFNETLESGEIEEAKLYLMVSRNEALNAEGRQELAKSGKILNPGRVFLEGSESGYITFSPGDFDASAASGIMYQLEIRGISSNGSSIILKSRNINFDYIYNLRESNRKAIILEERD
jgi:hypothetical protein